ncbi:MULTISPECIES: FxsA family protein [unclassified Ectothiorhodospira]|uniref:FxsA family protein n=1 Tax=unclassified Ectothiorhodospira TaxID=2684909 RepID=UPI001EE79A30|nr:MULTISPECIES: FxsA family protein [unclassified Ectothiorhodospira]MCG5515153.1 FxsA family protein [Ectothiorhodospira sp. 9100]MCG5519660.1 FxsA family protein [Ectothiorhodospira sp. 9905]
MPVFPILLIFFFTVPLVEIYVLIQVGGIIGVWATVGLVVLTAVVGAALLRRQGLATLTRVQQSMDRGQLPATELVEGFFLIVGGALLLTPGFVTDVAGFACLLPGSRRVMAKYLISRGVFMAHTHARNVYTEYRGQGPHPGAGPAGDPRRPGGGQTIDGEWEREEENRPEVEPPEKDRDR